MLCFSEREPGDRGPRRVRREEILDCFDSGWRVDSIEETRLETTWSPEGVQAWLARCTRCDSSPAQGRSRHPVAGRRPTDRMRSNSKGAS